MNHPLAGVYAAAVTPLKPDLSPDLEAIPELLDFLARRGCHGALLLGTTGEGPSFSSQERVQIFRAGLQVRESHPDFRLMAGTGTPSLSDTAMLTKTAFDLGIDAVVTLPPYYFRAATDDGLFAFFSEVIRKSVPEDGGLFGYHFPGVAGVGFSIELLTRLKAAFPNQFAGIKDSSHDPDFARSLGEHFGADLLVFTGTDSYLALAMDAQAGGCITAPANLISPDLRRLWDACRDGLDTSLLQTRVTGQRRILENQLPFPPTLKALLYSMFGFPHWPVRPPLVDVSQTKIAPVVQELANFLTEGNGDG
ncbi:MAG: dihydrodipicolinate synthase family protein [Chloroflexota bacterium]